MDRMGGTKEGWGVDKKRSKLWQSVNQSVHEATNQVSQSVNQMWRVRNLRQQEQSIWFLNTVRVFLCSLFDFGSVQFSLGLFCFVLFVLSLLTRKGLQKCLRPTQIQFHFCYAPKDMQTKLIWNAASGGRHQRHKIWASCYPLPNSVPTDVMACKQIPLRKDGTRHGTRHGTLAWTLSLELGLGQGLGNWWGE